MTEKTLQLRLLREFQDLEQEIAGLEISAEEIPKTIQSIETEVEAARAELVHREARKKDLERERVRREADVETERERLRKAQGKQLEVKTNKEYSALLQEMEAIKGKIDQWETEILELMESADTLAEAIRDGAGRLGEMEADAEVRKKEKREELDRIQDRLSDLRGGHQRISVDIDPEWLAQYSRIKAARGWAVAPLNSNSCSGCHQSLMPQLVHEIKHGAEIRTCPHCNRILYSPEEAKTPAETANPAEPAKA
ncbi:MAG: zinc ribbon domain-containing protein [Nitrospinota bacterium]